MRDMTTGSSVKKILMFALPLLVGAIFQQLYSMVDSIIVGRFVGTTAFAAVGSTGSITFFVFGLVFGSCSGFAIPVAQDFGAGNERGVRRCVANIVYIGVVFAAVVTVLTTLLTKQILIWMDTQPEMLADAYDYLFWIFLGLGAQMMYNMLAGILRSLGDSRTPLHFLILSCVLNILLDVALVIGMGVKGAVIATVVSQLVSGVLCLVYMAKKFPILRFEPGEFRPDGRTIQRLLGIGIPMGLQFSITAIGSIILQMSVNGLGVAAVASVSAAGKVHNLIVSPMDTSPMDTFGVSVATFTGQNYGARKLDRVRKGVRQVMTMMMAYAVVAFLANWLFAGKIALLFISAEETLILDQVEKLLFALGLFYPLLVVIQVLRNALQGVGFSKVSMLSGVFELIARTIMGLWIVPAFGFAAVCLAHPAAWVMADMVLIPLYFVLLKKLEHQMYGQQGITGLFEEG